MIDFKFDIESGNLVLIDSNKIEDIVARIISKGLKIGEKTIYLRPTYIDLNGNPLKKSGTITFGSAEDVNLYRLGANTLATDDQFRIKYSAEWDQLVFDSTSVDSRIAKTKVASAHNWLWIDAYGDSGYNVTVGFFRGLVDGTPRIYILKGDNSATPGIAIYPRAGSISIDEDTNLYRSAQDILKTDDNFDALALRIGGTEVISSGRVLQNITSISQSILPSLDGNYDLGDSSYNWRRLYLKISDPNDFILVDNAAISGDGYRFRITDDGGFVVVPYQSGAYQWSKEFGYSRTDDRWFSDLPIDAYSYLISGTEVLTNGRVLQNLLGLSNSRSDGTSYTLEWYASGFTGDYTAVMNQYGEDTSNFSFTEYRVESSERKHIIGIKEGGVWYRALEILTDVIRSHRTIRPISDDSLDLGTSSQRWRTLYVGDIQLPLGDSKIDITNTSMPQDFIRFGGGYMVATGKSGYRGFALYSDDFVIWNRSTMDDPSTDTAIFVIDSATGNVQFTGQAISLRIENRTSDPDSPAEGQIWIRTDL